jgi:YHS domain-containing protein
MNSTNPMDSMNTQNQSGAGMDPQVQGALNPDANRLDANDPNVAACPVCGTLVDKRTASDTLASPVNEQQGMVYFDTARCKATFEEDPQRYGSNF